MNLFRNNTDNLDIRQFLKFNNEESMITQLASPSTIGSKKRISKLTNRRTNEELIQQSYEKLIKYAESIDQKVMKIIQTYEVEFLQAYKQHVKRVREEMDDFKKRSLSNASSEQVFIDKIDALEKQLIIFREDALNSFQKIVQKDKQIGILKSKLKQVEQELKEKEKTIYQLLKKNKNNQVILEQVKIKQDLDKMQQSKQKQICFQKSDHKQYKNLYSPVSKQLFLDIESSRPFSTQLKTNRARQLSWKKQFQKKSQASKESGEISVIREKLEQKFGESKMVPINTVLEMMAQKKLSYQQQKKRSMSQFRKVKTHNLTRLEGRRGSGLEFDYDEIKKKSKQMMKTNELKQIFSNCVEQVKKQIGKRNKTQSLNFFKENGPSNYFQFKKMDHFALIETFFSQEDILKRLYQLIFSKNS